MAEGGFRLLIVLSGGVLTSWEAHPDDDHHESIQRLLDLGQRAAGSRVGLLRAALRGLGPHSRGGDARASAQRSRGPDRGIDLHHVGTEAAWHRGAKADAARKNDTRARHTAVASVLHLCRLMLQGDAHSTESCRRAQPQAGPKCSMSPPGRCRDRPVIACW